MTVLATRTQAGVLALGADNDVRIAFSDNTIEEFDLHAVEVRRLRYDAQERGLFVRHAPMRSRAIPEPIDPADPDWILASGVTTGNPGRAAPFIRRFRAG